MGHHQADQYININIIGVWEEKRVKGAERLPEEVMAKNLPNVIEDTNLQIQGVQ